MTNDENRSEVRGRKMRTLFLVIGHWSLVIFCSPLLAETSRESALAEASQAIEENVPQVAILKLQALLAQKISADERASATRELARALLADGRADEALGILNDAGDEDRLLKAEALGKLG